MFPRKEKVITRDMDYMGRGTLITRDMCFPGRATHITRDMGFPGGGKHIIKDIMCFPGKNIYISLAIRVSQVGEHKPPGICVSQVGNTNHQGYVFPR